MGSNSSSSVHSRILVNLQAFTQNKYGTHTYNYLDHQGKVMAANLTLTDTCVVARGKDGVKLYPTEEELQKDFKADDKKVIMDVRFGQGEIVFGEREFAGKRDPLAYPIWQVVNTKTETLQGDIFKLSQHILRVSSICFTAPTHTPLSPRFQATSQKTLQSVCRICYEPQTQPSNPIIMPCNCYGSMKYIHVQCLKNWIVHSKGYTSTRNGLRVKKDAFVCNVCKEEYEGKSKVILAELFRDNQCLREILMEKDVRLPYIKLEVMSESEDDNFIIVESLADGPVLIGRSKECQIRIGLDHLSRKHSQLSYNYQTGKVYIEDIGSSYGTLRFIQGPHRMSVSNQVLSLQVENTVMNFRGVVELKKVKNSKVRKMRAMKEEIIEDKKQKDQENIRTEPQLPADLKGIKKPLSSRNRQHS